MKRTRQLDLPLRTWGGKRRGAGRKPNGGRSGVPHRTRPRLSRHHPVHVTWRVRREIWNLRSRRAFRQIARAFAAAYARGRGFRLVHFSVQGNHLHLVCEADDQLRLSRGLQSLAIRVARGINRVMQRRGTVFADRFHEHILRSVREVAHAVRYVLGNFAIHALRRGDRLPERYVDPFSSAAPPDTGPPLVHQPTTWLLSIGWKRAAA